MIDLKAERKRAGITQKELAEQTSISRNQIAQIELGHAKPSVKTAQEIAAALHFEWSRFFEDAAPEQGE